MDNSHPTAGALHNPAPEQHFEGRRLVEAADIIAQIIRAFLLTSDCTGQGGFDLWLSRGSLVQRTEQSSRQAFWPIA
ncbi:hypothetical protein EDF56_1058 [Novosphingobium sp. PhB165]|nr:hypothetical protein EDF56_1058 [Novosphingobium sp. PhB165]